MSQPPIPGPFGDNCGLIREILGDEYQVVLAVYNKLPELRQMVKDVHDGAKEAIGNTTQEAVKQVDAGLADAQKKLSDQLDCINKEFNDRNDAVILSLRKSITDQVNNYRTQMDGWASTLIDSMRQSQQPIIDEATAAIEQAKEARVAELATALQDTANQRIADVNAAANTMIGQIKAAQSNIQVLQYTNTADDISQAPKPSDVTAPAILFFTLNQGKPANVFRAYTWNTASQSWGVKALEMDQPADGPKGDPGPAGSVIIPVSFQVGQAIPSVTRIDGSPVLIGDLLINAVDGSLYKNTSITVGVPNWVVTGSLRGPTGFTETVGINLVSSGNAVKLFAQMRWDGGNGTIETVKWPYGYIFKEPPVADFISMSYNWSSDHKSYNPVGHATDYDHAGIDESTITKSGFDYHHVGAWPGGQGEVLSVVVEGIPDYDAMKAAGWAPSGDVQTSLMLGVGQIDMFYTDAAVPSATHLKLNGGTFDQTVWPELYQVLGTNQLINAAGLTVRGRGTSGLDYDEGNRNGTTLPTIQKGSVIFGSFAGTICAPTTTWGFIGSDNWFNWDRMSYDYANAVATNAQVAAIRGTQNCKVDGSVDSQTGGYLYAGQGQPSDITGTTRMPNFNVVFAIRAKPDNNVQL